MNAVSFTLLPAFTNPRMPDNIVTTGTRAAVAPAPTSTISHPSQVATRPKPPNQIVFSDPLLLPFALYKSSGKSFRFLAQPPAVKELQRPIGAAIAFPPIYGDSLESEPPTPSRIPSFQPATAPVTIVGGQVDALA